MPANKPQYFLAIDNGTQSVRALVFDQHGQLVAKSKVDRGWMVVEPGLMERVPPPIDAAK